MTTSLYSKTATTSAMQVNGTDSFVFDSTGITSGSPAGFRNRIINGDMRIDQRFLGGSINSSLNVVTNAIDRWSIAASGSAVTMIRGGTVGNYNITLTGSAGNTATHLRQRIELQNIADLANKEVTVSFICSATVATSITISLSHATLQDNFNAVTGIGSAPKTITGTTARYTQTFTLPAGAVNGIELLIAVNSFTSGTFTIADVQLEAGAIATVFERRPMGLEFSLCQRYYWQIFNGSEGATWDQPVFGYANALTSTDLRGFIGFPVPMRAVPTIAQNAIHALNGTTSIGITVAVIKATYTGATVVTTAGTGFTAGASYTFRFAATGGSVSFSAEL